MIENPEQQIIIDYQVACSFTPLPTQQDVTHWVSLALVSHYQQAELTIRFVKMHEIQRLNCEYRHKNSPTNVLTFPCDETLALIPPLLGDIVICPSVVSTEVQQQGKKLAHHFAHLVIHGVLHLLGYDHQHSDEAHIMETMEIHFLQTLNIPNPYV